MLFLYLLLDIVFIAYFLEGDRHSCVISLKIEINERCKCDTNNKCRTYSAL